MFASRKGPRPDFDNITRTSRPAKAARGARARAPATGTRGEDGERLDPAQAPAEPKRPAKLYAAWLLGRREYSAQELRQRLKLKGYGPTAIEECLTFLAAHHLQDDARFAESRVRAKSRAMGNRRIRQDLANKGIAEDVALQAMAGLDEETERAQVASRRFEGKELTQVLKAKVWRFLMSRGFGSDAIKATLKRLEA